MTQEELELRLREAEPGDVIDLEGATVVITRPPLEIPEGVAGIALTNGTLAGPSSPSLIRLRR